jgi:hypothetical protein
MVFVRVLLATVLVGLAATTAGARANSREGRVPVGLGDGGPPAERQAWS